MSDYGIYVPIGADDSGFQSTFESVTASLDEWGLNFDKLYEKGSSFFKGFGIDIDKFASKIGTTGPMLAASVGVAAVAISGLQKVISETSKEFAEDETAQLRFNAALAANSSLAEGAAERLGEFAEEFGLLTGNATSATQSMITMLAATGRTEQQITDMMTAAQGLSVATGVDLNTALTQLNSTFSGTVGKLGKTTPALNGLTKEQLANGDAVKMLLDKYGAFSDTLADSSEVSMANFQNQLGELKSTIGGFFEGGIKPIRDGIMNIVKYMAEHKEVVIGVIEGIGYAIAVVMATFNPILGAVALVINGLFSLQHATGGWKLLWLETQKVVLTVVKAIIDYVSQMANSAIDGINAILKVYNSVADKFGGKGIQLLAKVDLSKAVGLTGALEDVTKKIDDARAANSALDKKVTAETVPAIETQTAALEDTSAAFSDAADSADDMSDTTVDASKKMSIAMIVASDRAEDAWDKFYNHGMSNLKDWGDFAVDVASTIEGSFGSALESLGQALYDQQDAWGSLAKAALSGLADVLSALGKQLTALAVVDAVTGKWGEAAIATAGAAAAFIASGLISAWADSYAATGADYTRAGNYIVGENGPEMIHVRQGSSIDNAATTRAALSSKSSGDTYIINAGQKMSAYDIARETRMLSRRIVFARS